MAALTDHIRASVKSGWSRNQIALAFLAAAGAFVSANAAGILPQALVRLPEELVPPLAGWLDVFFNFVRTTLRLEVLTRWIAEGPLQFLLDTTANLLEGKRRWPNLGPIPWPAIAGVSVVLGYWLGGWRLALLAGGTFLWTALIGQWKLAMQTMSVIVVAAPVAFFMGLTLGIFSWKSPRFEKALLPILSVLQTLPFFTYLLPAVIFFKVGPTAGAVATIIYAMPPMILMTTLGLKKVPPEIVEAGKMSGSTRWQMLRHVYIPAARTEILVGVNQVIMLCLAMVVLTAFIGMPGLGAKLLAMMGSFKLGRSFEIGVTIVLLAILLDRMSKAWVVKQPGHFEKGTPWWKQNLVLVLSVAVFVGFTGLAYLSRAAPHYTLEAGSNRGNIFQYLWSILDGLHRTQDLSRGKKIDVIIKGALEIDAVQATTGWIRWFLNVKVLIPFRNSVLWLPTPTVILTFAALGWWIGGRYSAMIAGGFFAIVALTGWWDRSMITLYTVISAVILATLIGLPVAIAAARSERWSQRVLLACDTAQTFPSFIYLIPTIMLFGINDVAVIFSILIFAMVPLVRYTVEGLRGVPAELTEAADMSGATRRQKLWKVKLPMALPTMAVGFNQAVMFAFFMVIIAAFIGTQDLGQELQRTLAGTDLGKNLVLGMNVALMALAINHIIMRWSTIRKQALGLG